MNSDQIEPDDSTSQIEGRRFASRYMRQKYPELFSDSSVGQEPIFTRDLFEHILANLTEHQKEGRFQEFIFHLVSAELVPNLIPQTGPSGGGDAGIDAWSYPVHPDLASTTWWNSLADPTTKKVALAVSAQKTVEAKVKHDVKSICSLNLGFELIYFVTSELVSTKKQVQLQKKFLDEYRVEVIILDRNWIIDRVFKDERQDLVVKYLQIEVKLREFEIKGIRDQERQTRLDEILKRLKDPNEYYATKVGIASDYLYAANLARSLEKPQHEVEAIANKGLNIAEQTKDISLQIQIGYFLAWSQIWFYDDPESGEATYKRLEPHLKETNQAEDLELYNNLQMCLSGSQSSGLISIEPEILDQRRHDLRSQLQSLVNDKVRPSAGLYAKALLHLMEIQEGFQDESKLIAGFNGLHNVLKAYEGKGTFPAMKFINLIVDLGELIGGIPEYEKLIDSIAQISTKLSGQEEKGRIYFERGMQLHKARHRPLEVVKYLTRAKSHLFKYDTMHAVVRASIIAAWSYAELGLDWAARLQALTAAHIAGKNVQAVRDHPLEAFWSFWTLARCEIALGRLKPAVKWLELCGMALHIVKEVRPEVLDKLVEELQPLDAPITILILRSGPDGITEQEALNRVLVSFDLFISESALAYVAGNADKALTILQCDSVPDKPTMEAYFTDWLQSPLADALPENWTFQSEASIVGRTELMGVKFKVNSQSKPECVLFQEYLLGMLESFYSLQEWTEYSWICEEMVINVMASRSGYCPPHIDNRPWVDETLDLEWCSDAFDWFRNEGRTELAPFMSQLFGFLELNCTIEPFKELMARIKRYFDSEQLHDLLTLSYPFIQLPDLLGEEGYG